MPWFWQPIEKARSRKLFGRAADGVDDEVDDGVGEQGDDETDNGVEDGVFCVGDLLLVAAGDDVADTTENLHDDGDDADSVEDGVGDVCKNTVVADELGRHTVSAGGFGSFLGGESHGATSEKRGSGSSAG